MKVLTKNEAERLAKEFNGSLDLRDTAITTLPENLTVGGSLDLRDTAITTLPENLTVGGALDLSGTPITMLPENLTVGGWLDLSGTPITTLPENLTVGGSLYLRDTAITTLPENLTVGGSLDLRDIAIKEIKYKRLKNGDYIPRRYLYADNILTHIKAHREIKGYIFYRGKIKGQNVVFDGNNYAHCSTFREGVADLKFKAAKDRGADQYSGLTLDSVLTAEEMITAYRVITGACKQGTERFVKSLGKLKDNYTIREAVEITKGQYNSDFLRIFSEWMRQNEQGY